MEQVLLCPMCRKSVMLATGNLTSVDRVLHKEYYCSGCNRKLLIPVPVSGNKAFKSAMGMKYRFSPPPAAMQKPAAAWLKRYKYISIAPPKPTVRPTAKPTVASTVRPTPRPTVGPTDKPTAASTVRPTSRPTVRYEKREETATLIVHPHYFDDDDYECTRCGIRFDDKKAYCPKCGARFTSSEEDTEEYDEEEDDEDFFDELDEEDR